MLSIPLNIITKDLLILLLLFILILCLAYIRKLKKQLDFEHYKRVHPQVQFELVTYNENNDHGFYVQNESFFLLKDIMIQDINATLVDSGFNQELTLKFDLIDFLKSKEKTKLSCKVFDKQGRALPDITEKIIPHLLNISFPVIIRYSTIEGRTFLATFMKKRDKFYEEKIELLQ
jgi:hypothetical protein